MSTPTNNEVGSQRGDTLRVLAVADYVEPQLYTSSINEWLAPVDLLISCGDLQPSYLDFLASTLGVPLMHVLGNHCFVEHNSSTEDPDKDRYLGAYDLNGHVAEYKGLLLAGLEGSPVYNSGPHQYTESQVAWNLWRLIPGLLRNKLLTGRYLDVLVTHTPPRGIHDNDDIAHRGFEALLPFVDRYRPILLLHGHTHRYQPMLPTQTRWKDTEIINAYGHVLLELARNDEKSGWKVNKVNSKKYEQMKDNT
ncbi:MAG: metallophosphoesterase [Chloroflexi bacterium]|nr:metallophosphoesterase [Chloroflexota bacterium]